MIPCPGRSLGFLMAAPGISDAGLDRPGIEIVARIGTGIRGRIAECHPARTAPLDPVE